MGLRAGVAVADVEFVQFHPTALHHPSAPRPLLSEALRGHGAVVRDAKGERFVDELVTRDELSRAMTSRMLDQGVEHLWLDATGLEDFGRRFPTIAASVGSAGLDPSTDWLPIAPAAHYLCGGVVTDLDGATSLPGLWACGEVACTGVHGANRLASNSLLEGMVFGPRVVEAIEAGCDGPRPTGAMQAVLDGAPGIGSAMSPDEGWFAYSPGAQSATGVRQGLQEAMTSGAGVVRTDVSLKAAGDALGQIATTPAGYGSNRERHELRNLLTIAFALVSAAATRTESRGCHWRADHPGLDPAFRRRLLHLSPVLSALTSTPCNPEPKERER
jgi:L-aspartate oxidase